MANESSGKKALKAGLGYTVGNMLVKGLSFLAIPLFARLMTVEDFGIYSTFSSYVMIVTVLAGFTLHTSVRNAKLDYAERTGSYCSSVTLLVIGNSLLLLALSLVFAAPLARVLSLEQPYLPALIVLESFGMAMLTFYNSVLSVDYRYKEYLVLSLVYAVAGIGGSMPGPGVSGPHSGHIDSCGAGGHLCGGPPVAEGAAPGQPGILALRYGNQSAHRAPRPEPAAAEPV